MTIRKCINKNHLSRYWLEQLLERYDREPVLDYACRFSESPLLGIAALRWWVRYRIGPEQETRVRELAESLERFESTRRPYAVECDRCPSECQARVVWEA